MVSLTHIKPLTMHEDNVIIQQQKDHVHPAIGLCPAIGNDNLRPDFSVQIEVPKIIAEVLVARIGNKTSRTDGRHSAACMTRRQHTRTTLATVHHQLNK